MGCWGGCGPLGQNTESWRSVGRVPVLVDPGKRGGWGAEGLGEAEVKILELSQRSGSRQPGLLGLRTRTPVLEEGKTRGLVSWVTRNEAESLASWRWGRRPGVAFPDPGKRPAWDIHSLSTSPLLFPFHRPCRHASHLAPRSPLPPAAAAAAAACRAGGAPGAGGAREGEPCDRESGE